MFIIKGRIITCKDDEVIENGIVAVDKNRISFVGRENEWYNKGGYEFIDFKEDGKYIDKMTTYEEFLKLYK